jgi:hypothetical protein
MADKVTDQLLDVAKHALTDAGEHRLFRAGKLDGLFAGRTPVNNEAAATAIREGILEVVRTEVKGKATTEWVRATPKAVEFVHRHESPAETLQDLQAILRTSSEGIPLWLVDIRQRLDNLSVELTREAQKWTQRLEALSQQIADAVARTQAAAPAAPKLEGADAQWAHDALGYLERRQSSGAAGDCSLAELFSALRERHADLAVVGFHDRLVRMQDRGLVKLLPYVDDPTTIPEPEYALPEGMQLLYYVVAEPHRRS